MKFIDEVTPFLRSVAVFAVLMLAWAFLSGFCNGSLGSGKYGL